jgi:hypothetical protein
MNKETIVWVAVLTWWFWLSPLVYTIRESLSPIFRLWNKLWPKKGKVVRGTYAKLIEPGLRAQWYKAYDELVELEKELNVSRTDPHNEHQGSRGEDR